SASAALCSRGQPPRNAEAGPPWMATTIGYFLLGSTFAGASIQPCTSRSSLRQRTSVPSPQSEVVNLLTLVICFQSPIAPVQISGGCRKPSWITALVLPSRATDTPISPVALTTDHPSRSTSAAPS